MRGAVFLHNYSFLCAHRFRSRGRPMSPVKKLNRYINLRFTRINIWLHKKIQLTASVSAGLFAASSDSFVVLSTLDARLGFLKPLNPPGDDV